ncbi:MAG: GNAT family N-acetyltransferase [Clostridiales bacterium]|jgi:GNAT superfamily N-acetyltransferase|nr:GNAT family N-acetyltransferase [Clostridiales bacterium]
MPDMLVKLYDMDFNFADLSAHGITIKKAHISDKKSILDFVKTNFQEAWANECEYGLFNNPITCYVAVCDKKIVGFACYDTSAKGFFGPTGVSEEFRGKGIGRELLLRALFSMKESGYAYAIIGWSADEAIAFYQKYANAVVIEDSPPNKSIYKNLISQE